MAGYQVVECPCCHAKFEFEPSKNVDYKAKDDTGKTVSRQTAEHMAKYRVRCGMCKENFCVNCGISPYHINFSCEEAARKAKALKCRFCLEELKEPSLSRDPNFQDVCRKPECVQLMKCSCNKTLPCGHRCGGYTNERQCLPCL